MTKVRVESFSISLDGFGASPDQDIDHPLGVGGNELHQWFLLTKTFQTMHSEMPDGGDKDGMTGVDDNFAARGFKNIGTWIIARNMFGPVRGPLNDSGWKGWWGESVPPYHVPVFVLTHYERPSIEKEGGNIFHFETGGIHEALEKAREAADGEDVRIVEVAPTR